MKIKHKNIRLKDYSNSWEYAKARDAETARLENVKTSEANRMTIFAGENSEDCLL